VILSRDVIIENETTWQSKMDPPIDPLHIGSTNFLFHSLSKAIGFTHQFQDVSVMGETIQ